jgi:hypothetical protein
VIIIYARVYSGCTSISDEPGLESDPVVSPPPSTETIPSSGGPQVPSPRTTVDSTAAMTSQDQTLSPQSLEIGSSVSSLTLFSPNYTWVEYQDVVSAHGKTVIIRIRTMRSLSDYQGTPAIRYLNTGGAEGNIVIQEVYMELAVEHVLGETAIMVVDGQEIYNTSINPENYENYAGLSWEEEQSLVSEGWQVLVVPAGTLHAGKYSMSSPMGEILYWAAPGIPVPVKYS